MQWKPILLVCLLTLGVAPANAVPVPKNERVFVRTVLYHCLLGGKTRREARELSQQMSMTPDDPFVKALLLINQGKYDQAVNQLDLMRPESANTFDALLWKAFCFSALHKQEEQFEQYKKAEEIRPSSAEVCLCRSIAYSRLKNFEGARRDIETAKSRERCNANLFDLALGHLAREEGKYEEAVLHFNHASEIEPADADTYALAGSCYLRLNKKTLALEKWKKAVKADPTQPFIRAGLGTQLEALGRFRDAITEYDAALKIAPTYKKAHGYKGDCLLSLKLWKQAIQEYTMAVNMEPLKEKVDVKDEAKLQQETKPLKEELSLGSPLPIRIFRKSLKSEMSRENVLNALAVLPDSLILTMREHGVSVVISPTIAEYNLSLNENARQENRSLWDNAVGLYKSKRKEIVIGEDGLNDSRDNNVGLVLHECGHAYDHCREGLSKSLAFKLRYAQDFEALTNAQRRKFKNYQESGQTGCEQLFADLFAYRYTDPFSCGSYIQDLLRMFPRCHSYVREECPGWVSSKVSL